MTADDKSTVITLRVSRKLERQIDREARRRRRTRSAVLREVLERALGGGEHDDDPAHEARRQSLLVSGRDSEREALAFIEDHGDARGWR